MNERGREGDEGGGVKGQRKRDRASPTSVASVNQVEVLKKFYFTVKYSIHPQQKYNTLVFNPIFHKFK